MQLKGASLIACAVAISCLLIDSVTPDEPASIKRYYNMPEVIAIVDGEPIKRDDFVARLVCDYGDEVLRSMITLMLIEQEARKRGISVTDKDVLERFNELFEALAKGDTERLVRAGLPASVTPMMLWAEAKKYLLLERMLKSEIRIDEADIRKRWYAPHVQRRYNPPPMYDVREIGVYTADEANAIWSELVRAQKARRDLTKVFSELAAKRSKLPTARLMGSKGYLSLDEFPHEYKLILQTARAGEIFPPMQAVIDGISCWVILWVRDIKKPPKVSYEEAKPEIEAELFAEQLALKSREFIRTLWERALKGGRIKVIAEPLKEGFEKGLLGELVGAKKK